ncbi:hypothetical protein C8J57DRAFT_1289937 [Mycena rebaudengoi]|nr:hypothetical protein C8J57DRAFT_1289937 [Mycena rebaudengoi]
MPDLQSVSNEDDDDLDDDNDMAAPAPMPDETANNSGDGVIQATTHQDIRQTLWDIVNTGRRIFIVIDGLDECASELQLLTLLKNLNDVAAPAPMPDETANHFFGDGTNNFGDAATQATAPQDNERQTIFISHLSGTKIFSLARNYIYSLYVGGTGGAGGTGDILGGNGGVGEGPRLQADLMVVHNLNQHQHLKGQNIFQWAVVPAQLTAPFVAQVMAAYYFPAIQPSTSLNFHESFHLVTLSVLLILHIPRLFSPSHPRFAFQL